MTDCDRVDVNWLHCYKIKTMSYNMMKMLTDTNTRCGHWSSP